MCKRLCYFATIVGLAIAPLLLAVAPAAGSPTCQLGTLETLHLDPRARAPIVEGSADGHRLWALLDTGSSMTALSRSFAERASLEVRPTRARSLGVGGRSEVFSTHVQNLAFGPIHTENIDLDVLWNFKNPRVDAIVGVNVLLSHDLEMALAAGEVRVFLPVGCDPAFLAYWDPQASSVPMNAVSVVDHRQIITIQVNGSNLRALIDSGAFRSVIDTVAARLIGVTEDSASAASRMPMGGIGSHVGDYWIAPIHEVIIGKETIRDTQIAVADLFRAAFDDLSINALSQRNRLRPFDMLLGQDFLRSHRVLFSLLQGRFYFSYVGGRAFAVEPESQSAGAR